MEGGLHAEGQGGDGVLALLVEDEVKAQGSSLLLKFLKQLRSHSLLCQVQRTLQHYRYWMLPRALSGTKLSLLLLPLQVSLSHRASAKVLSLQARAKLVLQNLQRKVTQR